MGKRGLRFSLEGKLALAFSVALLAGLFTMALAAQWLDSAWLAMLIAAPVAVAVGLYLLHLFVVPFNRVVQALADGVSGLSDGDFSLSIAETRNDELGRLVAAYNEVGDVLRAERQSLYQRELMLDTVIQTSPLALVLTGTERCGGIQQQLGTAVTAGRAQTRRSPLSPASGRYAGAVQKCSGSARRRTFHGRGSP